MKLLIVLSVVGIGTAHATDWTVTQCKTTNPAKDCEVIGGGRAVTDHAATHIEFNTGGSKVLQMEQGSCLRGPLRFLDHDSHSYFELSAGADYPAGCSQESN